MRLVQVIVPEGKREVLVDLLEERSIDFVISPETSQREYSDVLFFPIPREGVEEILDELREAGLEEDGFTVVTKAEAVVAKKFEELQEKYQESEETDESRVARQELKASAENLSPSLPTYYLLTFAATVIATAGILLDSTPVVVGSMVIAPLIGPAMASCVGTVINDGELFSSGIKKQSLGTLLAVGGSALFARVALSVFVPTDMDLFSLSQVSLQLHPGFLSLVIALGSGLAGAYSLTSGINSALVGVMISVALLPPAATVGLGIAVINPRIAAGAGLLLFINLISINLAGTLTLWLKNYKPGRWYEQKGAEKATRRRLATLLILMVLVSAFLGFTTWNMHVNHRKSEVLKEEIGSLLKEEGGNLLGFEIQKEGVIIREFAGVKLMVSDVDYKPGLADRIGEVVRDELDEKLNLVISYRRVERVGSESDSPVLGEY